MDSKPFSQSVSKAKTFQEINETSQLLMFPVEVLTGILKFLDMKTLVSSLFLTCKLFCPSFRECSVAQRLFLGHLGYVYEPFMFSKGVPISRLTPEDHFQQHYFRPNVDLSSGENVQPMGMNIHVFTTSDSKEIHLDKIVSMIIESSSLNSISENTRKTLQFLNDLFKNPFDSPKNLKFSGFLANRSLWKPLSTLKKLDWLHWICSVSDDFIHIFSSFSGLKRLHLEVEAGFDLLFFPGLPSSLEEFSLHLSSVDGGSHSVFIYNCTCLKRM